MNKDHCRGCRNDFYNGNNECGVKNCFSLKAAKMITRFRISIHTPMNRKSGYTKMKLPNCYHQKGSAYLEKIPDYAE